MTKFRQYLFLPALPIGAFLVCTIFLQTKKTPWVDECYTYYGITHDNWGEFVDSICSGINFSPPLYFFLNWIIQLAFHIPIEVLRIESSLWIALGSFLIFLKCTKLFGVIPAFLGLTIVLLQSNILMEQALEARHYGMLFACSSLVLFLFPPNGLLYTSNRKILYSLALLALGLTHYLGLVFCVTAGLVRFWFLRKNRSIATFLFPELATFAVIIAVYLTMLSIQSSHLNTWEKDDSFTNLLALYIGSLTPLTVAVPVTLFCLSNISRAHNPQRKELPRIVVLSIIWFFTPLAFWIISHVSTFNLIKDRYFIPKEAAVMVLISYFFHRIVPMFDTSKSSLSSKVQPFGGTFLVCISLLLLSSKRTLFGFDPSIDYHRKLLLSETIFKNPLPKFYLGDHLFFPNYYNSDSQSENQLIITKKELALVYERFNCMIETKVANEFISYPFILIIGKNDVSIFNRFPSNIYERQRLEIHSDSLIMAHKIKSSKEVP